MQTGHDNEPFDALASAYARFRSGYSDALIELVVEAGLAPGTRALDVACGTGLALAPFAARGVAMTGIDPSEEMLREAQRAQPHATFVPGRAEALPFANAAFDGTICAQAIHWFDHAVALREMIRVTVPGGPVAVWWKNVVSDDPVRVLRAQAEARHALPPVDGVMARGFRAFFAAPFAQRRVRVLPHAVRYTVDGWLGYERSRARSRAAFGVTQLEAYLGDLRTRLLAYAGSASAEFEVRYAQYLYIGKTATT
jgi:ubiquinone/menaquinone biosynthesis C-methylase UbiE